MSEPPFQPSTPYPQQPYGQPYPALPQPHPQGTMVLVLGIVGCFMALCAPFAWYFGSRTLSEIQASGVRYSNEDQIRVGRMLGKVISIVAIIALVFGLLLVLVSVVGIMVASSG